MTHYIWSHKEDEDLRRMWVDPSLSMPAIAEILGRSMASIRTRAYKLRLPFRAPNSIVRAQNVFNQSEARRLRLKSLTVDEIKRKCLRCSRDFPAHGKYNRICECCKGDGLWENSRYLYSAGVLR